MHIHAITEAQILASLGIKKLKATFTWQSFDLTAEEGLVSTVEQALDEP